MLECVRAWRDPCAPIKIQFISHYMTIRHLKQNQEHTTPPLGNKEIKFLYFDRLRIRNAFLLKATQMTYYASMSDSLLLLKFLSKKLKTLRGAS